MGKIDRLTRHAKKHFELSEDPIAVVLGAYECKIMGQDSARNGIMLATEDRVLFYGKKLTGFDAEEIPYGNISSLEMGKGLLGHVISFFASGNKVKMKWIQKGDVAGLVGAVRSRIGQSTTDSNISSIQDDIPGQIEKLGKLRDQSLLTEEEFRDKKAELLQRI